jgi:LysM repeat protein
MSRAVSLLALLAAACASGEGAPISYGGGGAASYEPPPQRAGRAPIERRDERPDEAAPVRTQAAQDQPDWADGEGTPLSQYALQPSDAQPFDPARLPRTHRVRENESLYDVATTYQVPLRALIDQNNLEPPYALAPGRELRLPPPRFHTVARGESFEDVAARYHVDRRSLALLNRMQPPYRVRAGDRLVLPAMARPVEVAAAEPPPPAPRSADRAPAAGNGRFAWPLRGEIVARFGTQPGGARLDGVEIAGREGASICRQRS